MFQDRHFWFHHEIGIEIFFDITDNEFDNNVNNRNKNKFRKSMPGILYDKKFV